VLVDAHPRRLRGGAHGAAVELAGDAAEQELLAERLAALR
jgi:hypothetical protein